MLGGKFDTISYDCIDFTVDERVEVLNPLAIKTYLRHVPQEGAQPPPLM